MKKFKPVVAVIMIGGLLAVLWGQCLVNERLRRDSAVLKNTVRELTRLQETSDPVVENNSLTQAQLDELAKLRSEVTRLREQTNRIGVLDEEHQKLIASLKEAKNSPPAIPKKKGPEDALPQDIHPRNSWAFRGFATPEATVESFFWGQANGDRAALLEVFAPDMLPKAKEELEGKNLAEEARKIKTEEFRIVDQRQLSDDEVALTIYTARHYDDGQFRFDELSPTVFQRIGGEWKMTDKRAPNN